MGGRTETVQKALGSSPAPIRSGGGRARRRRVDTRVVSRFAATLVLLTTTGPLRAAEEAPAQPAPLEESIAAARRELSALKATQAAAGVPAAAPTVTIPQLHLEQREVPRKDRTNERKAGEKRSANWLVDGVMRRKGDAQGLAGRDGRERWLEDRAMASGGGELEDPTEDRFRNMDAQDPHGEMAASQRDQKRRPAEHERPLAVANPLGGFLSEWMTPQDYALLRRSVEPKGVERLPGGGVGSDVSPSGVAGNGATTFEPFGLELSGGEKPAFMPAKPAENPYLQALALPDLAPTISPPPGLPAPQTFAPVRQPPPSDPSPVAVEPPPLPDFLKRTADEKYFKPLKRF